MKDYTEIVKSLLKNEINDPQIFNNFKIKIIQLIKKVFRKIFGIDVEKSFKKYYGDDYLEDIFEELLLRLIQKKDIILNLDFISESYLFVMIQNIIYTHLSSNFKLIKKQRSITEVFSKNEEDSVNKVSAEIPSTYFVDYLKNLKYSELYEEFFKKLKEKDKEVLCYYLAKKLLKKELVIKNLTQQALYKRWERLKKKLYDYYMPMADKDLFEDLKIIFEKFLSDYCLKRYSYK
ncbi:MAG: hypothetical protein J7K20_07515 [Thermodesulfobacterium sp.]|nr:hypothetical protein [Thermodesulfobacterium sp.]